jgi:hypothetical protein
LAVEKAFFIRMSSLSLFSSELYIIYIYIYIYYINTYIYIYIYVYIYSALLSSLLILSVTHLHLRPIWWWWWCLLNINYNMAVRYRSMSILIRTRQNGISTKWNQPVQPFLRPHIYVLIQICTCMISLKCHYIIHGYVLIVITTSILYRFNPPWDPPHIYTYTNIDVEDIYVFIYMSLYDLHIYVYV